MDKEWEWTCPNCGKVYPVPPKWCPCEPYPPNVDQFYLESGGGKRTYITEEEYQEHIDHLLGKGVIKRRPAEGAWILADEYEREDGVTDTGLGLVREIDDSTPGTAVGDGPAPTVRIPLTDEEFRGFMARKRGGPSGRQGA